MYKDAQPAGTAYGLVYLRATQGTLVSPPRTRSTIWISTNIHKQNESCVEWM
jgi:hypothetical protein